MHCSHPHNRLIAPNVELLNGKSAMRRFEDCGNYFVREIMDEEERHRINEIWWKQKFDQIRAEQKRQADAKIKDDLILILEKLKDERTSKR